MNFTPLTDEQLLELLKSTLQETINRGQAVQDAAREIMLSEKEKMEIRKKTETRVKEELKEEEARRIARETEEELFQQAWKEKSQKQQQQLKEEWEFKKKIAEKITPFFRYNFTIKVWQNGTDKRVYLNSGKEMIACLYCTGNSKKIPGSIDYNYILQKEMYEKCDLNEAKTAVKEGLEEVANTYKNISIDLGEAIKYNA